MAPTELVALPEGCISQLLSLTSPKDVCRSSATSRSFRSAADSDVVWEAFLPKEYRNLLLPRLIPRDDDPPSFNFPTKRDLYFRLCQPTLFGNGSQSFFLEKSTGKTCFMLSARHLSIIWGDAPQYWNWISLPESRFREVAELINVCWLEIGGNFSSKLLSPKTTYVAYLVYKLRRSHRGFNHPLQSASITVGGNQLPTETVSILPGNQDADEEQDTEEIPRSRQLFRYVTRDFWRRRRRLVDRNGWMETALGEFFNDGGDEVDISISFREIDGGQWKSGLIVEGIEVRPKNL